MPNALPAFTAEERAENLAKAAAASSARAEVKGKLKSGVLTLPDVLRDAETDDVLGKIKVSAALEALPGVGKVKAAQIMQRHGIAETRRLRGLGPNQKSALEAEFAA